MPLGRTSATHLSPHYFFRHSSPTAPLRLDATAVMEEDDGKLFMQEPYAPSSDELCMDDGIAPASEGTDAAASGRCLSSPSAFAAAAAALCSHVDEDELGSLPSPSLYRASSFGSSLSHCTATSAPAWPVDPSPSSPPLPQSQPTPASTQLCSLDSPVLGGQAGELCARLGSVAGLTASLAACSWFCLCFCSAFLLCV